MKPKQRGLLHRSGVSLVLINNSAWAIDSALSYPCSLHMNTERQHAAQATPVFLTVALIAGLDLAPHAPQ